MDVLTVDDIPTLDSLRTLLLYAERGHLVIANLHADSVVDAFERLIQAAGAEEHALRQSLARNLVALSAQRLVRRSDMAGRGAVIEWVMATPAVREVILSGVPARLADLQRTDPDCRSVETAVNELVSAGQISEETAAEILAGVAPR
jgi:Tfp pilus assembly pilus retraction ATPase PilT